MRIQKGHPRFSKRELWNLDSTLAPIIHQALVQFKDSHRHGFPMYAVTDYLKEVKGLTEEQITEMFKANPNGNYDREEVAEFFETILDKMIFAFSKEAKKEYEDIEECPTLCSFTDPQAFEDEDLEPDEKGLSRIFFKPKKGYTKEDVDAYWVRHKEFNKVLENKIDEGLKLFSRYFYSLWD